MLPAPLQFGLNYRDFPGNWRPALEEIAFAAAHGFAAIQFHGREAGLREEELGAPAFVVGAAAREARLVPTMEIIVRIDGSGQAAGGRSPLDVLRANHPAIAALGCTHVHWHLVPRADAGEVDWASVEPALAPQFAAGVALGAAHGFRCGIEHNEPEIPLFPTPARCAAALDATPGLGLAWDLNHTAPGQREGYLALAGRMIALHLADTPLPAVNHHLPLGLGTIDFPATFAALLARGFRGPATLEIGGLPHSGSYGRDTDEALIDSLRRCRAAIGSTNDE